jgi:ketosteroid isomerase-like protein
MEDSDMTAQDVLQVHQDVFYGALLSCDLDSLATLYSDDYTLVRSDGSSLNKNQVLRDLREGGLAFTSIMSCIEDVRLLGAVALVIGESHVIALRDGVAMSLQFRLVAVYRTIGGDLRLSYFQSTDLSHRFPVS